MAYTDLTAPQKQQLAQFAADARGPKLSGEATVEILAVMAANAEFADAVFLEHGYKVT